MLTPLLHYLLHLVAPLTSAYNGPVQSGPQHGSGRPFFCLQASPGSGTTNCVRVMCDDLLRTVEFKGDEEWAPLPNYTVYRVHRSCLRLKHESGNEVGAVVKLQSKTYSLALLYEEYWVELKDRPFYNDMLQLQTRYPHLRFDDIMATPPEYRSVLLCIARPDQLAEWDDVDVDVGKYSNQSNHVVNWKHKPCGTKYKKQITQTIRGYLCPHVDCAAQRKAANKVQGFENRKRGGATELWVTAQLSGLDVVSGARRVGHIRRDMADVEVDLRGDGDVRLVQVKTLKHVDKEMYSLSKRIAYPATMLIIAVDEARSRFAIYSGADLGDSKDFSVTFSSSGKQCGYKFKDIDEFRSQITTLLPGCLKAKDLPLAERYP